MSGELLTIDDYERAARAILPRATYGYYSAGADEQRTLRDNRRAFKRWEIWYRVLVDVSKRSLATTVLGTPVPMPILVAPTAYHKLAHPDGELATARAASKLGTVLVVSTLATTALDEVAREATCPKWFQLY